MGHRSRFGFALALVVAISALAIVAAPAAAETVLVNCNGTCGSFQVGDHESGGKGAVCVYQNGGSYNLKEITVRPPKMYGVHSTKTKVGWRFKVQRQSVGGGSWHAIFTSSYRTAKASNAVPASVGSGFTRGAWHAPSNPTGYRYRVWIEMQWWHGSGVQGFARVQYDWYKAQRTGFSYTNPDYCLQSY